MLNPSSADEVKDDPTIRRCIAFSKGFGFGALTVVNLYPFRTKSPKELRSFGDLPFDFSDEMRRNHEVICATAGEADVIIVAWGDAAWHTDWYSLTHGIPRPRTLRCLGTTKSGAPRHPLYVRGDQPLETWRSV